MLGKEVLACMLYHEKAQILKAVIPLPQFTESFARRPLSIKYYAYRLFWRMTFAEKSISEAAIRDTVVIEILLPLCYNKKPTLI
jgi:hypothetical protein